VPDRQLPHAPPLAATAVPAAGCAGRSWIEKLGRNGLEYGRRHVVK
jgi:hypothetical protein